MGWRRGLRVSKAGVVVTFSILANLLQDFKTPGDESDGGVQRTALGPVQEANLTELCAGFLSQKNCITGRLKSKSECEKNQALTQVGGIILIQVLRSLGDVSMGWAAHKDGQHR